MLKRDYMHESLNYVLKIQDVQERIKFEFVEILLGFMSGWLVFYHLGHEVAEDAKEYMTDLQHKVQKVSVVVHLKWQNYNRIHILFRPVKASQNFNKLLRNLNPNTWIFNWNRNQNTRFKATFIWWKKVWDIETSRQSQLLISESYFIFQRPSQQHGRNIIVLTKSKTNNLQCCNTINRYQDEL